MIAEGTPIRFKDIRGLGTLHDRDSLTFGDHTVRAGDEGTYSHEHPRLPDWHMCVVLVDDEQLFVPCLRSQFEVLG